MDSNNTSLKVVFCKSLFWFGFIFLIGRPQKGNQEGNWTCNTLWEAQVSLKSEEGSAAWGSPVSPAECGGRWGPGKQQGEAAAGGPCEGWECCLPSAFLFFVNSWLCWVCPAAWALPQLQSMGVSLQCLPAVGHQLQALELQKLQLRAGLPSTGSVIVPDGLSCSKAHGIFPDQGSNPCSLHGQADYLPLSHRGSPPLPSFCNLPLA